MKRVKVTIPPPKVCGTKCWWRLKCIKAEAALQRLRRDLISFSARYHALVKEQAKADRRGREQDRDRDDDGDGVPPELDGYLR